MGSSVALAAAEVALLLLPRLELLALFALPVLLLIASSLLPLSVMLCASSWVSSSAELAAVEALALTLSTQPALASVTRLETSLDSEDVPASSSVSLLLVALAAALEAGELVVGVVVVGVFVVVAGAVVVGVGVVVADEELLEHVMASVSRV